jgi:hypothetical protein
VTVTFVCPPEAIKFPIEHTASHFWKGLLCAHMGNSIFGKSGHRNSLFSASDMCNPTAYHACNPTAYHA